MKRIFSAVALLCLSPAWAGVPVESVQVLPSSDGVLYSRYPDGDNPGGDPGTDCDVPSGWACESIGDGSGSIIKVSDTEWEFDVVGTNNATDNRIAYKDAGGNDVIFIARITDSFAGSAEPFAAVGIGLREAATQASFLIQCHSLQNGATALQVRFGESSSYTTVNGAPGQSRPRYCGMTYDEDQNDLRAWASDDGSAWTQIAQTTRDMSAVLAYAVAASASADVSLQATLDNISLDDDLTAIYTPAPPPDPDPPNDAPVWTTIPNQSGAQDINFSFDCSIYASDPNDDPLTFTASGLSGRGLSMTTGCLITGTPNSTALADSPFNVSITATDTDGAQGIGTFQMTITPAPEGGSVFTIGTGTTARTYNAGIVAGLPGGANWSTIRTSGSNARPLPGDIIQFTGGTHGFITLSNVVGTASSPITIRNNPASSGPAVFRKANNTGGGFLFTLSNANGVVVDGTQKWSGAPSGTCGITMPGFVEGKTQCGIQLETDGSEPGPSSWVRFNGFSCTTAPCVIKGVEVDGTGTTSAGGIGIALNDQAVKLADNPGVWRQDFTATQNYIHNIGFTAGEGFYVGPNAVNLDLPLRRIEISYNLVEDTKREGINGKSWEQGPNYVRYNVVRRSGIGQTDQNRCINIVDGGDVDIYSNIVERCGGEGILHINNGKTTANAVDDGPYYSNIYNNIVYNAGEDETGSTGAGIRARRGSSTDIQFSPITIEYNTIITPGGPGVSRESITGTCNARNNIIADAGGTAVVGCTSTNNRTGTVASQQFVAAGSRNYRLTSGSPARNDAIGTCPSDDFESDVRPQQGSCDQGADEFVP